VDLLTYFQKVEEGFCGRRGAPLLLSPLDFAKAAEWYDAGVGVDVVLEGLNRYFERLEQRKVPLKRAICLSFAEDQILDAMESRRTAAVGRAAGLDEPTEAPALRVRAFLEDAEKRCRSFVEDPARGREFPIVSRYLEEVMESLESLMDETARPFSELEKTLAPLDMELGRLVLLESPAQQVKVWREAAADRLREAGGVPDPAAARSTVERLAKQSAMKHLELPRLSLLYLDA
jgi:hypothetical protein